MTAETALDLAPADDGRAFVFASLGTLQGGRSALFRGIAKACRLLDLQLLVAHRSALSSVRFPARARRIDGGYASISSQRFAACTQLRLGFQKFLGQEVQTAAPVLMNAAVRQHEGYRFVYVLPLSDATLLTEDTFYSDAAGIDATRLRRNIGDYALAQGGRIQALLREEHGVLPIVLGGDVEAFWREAYGVPPSGLSAGLFHPTTGHSLPEAVALAELICDRKNHRTSRAEATPPSPTVRERSGSTHYTWTARCPTRKRQHGRLKFEGFAPTKKETRLWRKQTEAAAAPKARTARRRPKPRAA